jgi:DNA polymerase-3 subunit gamma/tau
VLESLQKAAGRRPWTVVSTTTVHAFDGEVLTLGFTNENDVASFRPAPGAPVGESVSEHLRAAILDVLGIRVKFLPRVEADQSASPEAAPTLDPVPESEPESTAVEPEPEPGPAVEPETEAEPGWNVTVIPGAEPAAPVPAKAGARSAAKSSEESPEKPAKTPATKPAGRVAGKSAATTASGSARYGEAVVREILGANFLEEQPIGLRDQPVTLGPDTPPDLGPEA